MVANAECQERQFNSICLSRSDREFDYAVFCHMHPRDPPIQPLRTRLMEPNLHRDRCHVDRFLDVDDWREYPQANV